MSVPFKLHPPPYHTTVRGGGYNTRIHYGQYREVLDIFTICVLFKGGGGPGVQHKNTLCTKIPYGEYRGVQHIDICVVQVVVVVVAMWC